MSKRTEISLGNHALVSCSKGLTNLNSWKVGGAAEYFAQPENLSQLVEVLNWWREQSVELTVLGGGTNVLIADSGIAGLVLHTEKLNNLDHSYEQDNLKVIAETGVLKMDLMRLFFRNKLTPSFMLAGLPGNVGGGVAMNAGVSLPVQPKEFCELVEWVEVVSLEPEDFGKIKKIPTEKLVWKYRKCEGWQPGVIYRVGLKWPIEQDPEVGKKIGEMNRYRVQNQPLDKPSCGSVFKNPEGKRAGQLIDSVGLKGHKVGGAQVSTKHANFIINAGGATATDIRTLIELVQDRVYEKCKIKLETEVVFLGKW